MRSSIAITLAVGLAVLLAAAAAFSGSAASENPRELGRVAWSQDLDAARETAARTGKPILLLFQEIPGCKTCVDFGRSPLSQPLLVEAIESEFLPVVVYNNRPGRDAELCVAFGEPAWNFPVMRFIDGAGKDIVPRRDRIWTAADVGRRLIEALVAADRTVPAYLKLAAMENRTKEPARVTFAMHCFWDGEGKLGGLDGVLATRAGWVGGDEVVEVTFDPSLIEFDTLLDTARGLGCAERVYAHDAAQLAAARRQVGDAARPLETPARPAKPADQKYSLQRTEAAYLPLTPLQATRFNAALRRGGDPMRWLSPRQRELLVEISGAIELNPKTLDGLKRPDEISKLPAYEDALVKRLRGST